VLLGVFLGWGRGYFTFGHGNPELPEDALRLILVQIQADTSFGGATLRTLLAIKLKTSATASIIVRRQTG
jgi:hypothetical protein